MPSHPPHPHSGLSGGDALSLPSPSRQAGPAPRAAGAGVSSPGCRWQCRAVGTDSSLPRWGWPPAKGPSRFWQSGSWALPTRAPRLSSMSTRLVYEQGGVTASQAVAALLAWPWSGLTGQGAARPWAPLSDNMAGVAPRPSRPCSLQSHSGGRASLWDPRLPVGGGCELTPSRRVWRLRRYLRLLCPLRLFKWPAP